MRKGGDEPAGVVAIRGWGGGEGREGDAGDGVVDLETHRTSQSGDF